MKITAITRSLCASRWTTYLMKYSSPACKMSIDTQVSRKITAPKIKGLFFSAALSDSLNLGCSECMKTGRSRVVKKTVHNGIMETMAKMTAIRATLDAFSGRMLPMIIKGMVKAANPPAIEKNMRNEVSEVRSS